MRVPRFYLDARLVAGEDLVLPPDVAQHAARVLRLRPGDALALFNGDGDDYLARVTATPAGAPRVRIESLRPAAPESPLRIVLAQALARGDKMDWIIQKATELGVAAIVPLLTERSGVRLDADRAAARATRWRAIAASACAQSGRGVLPSVDPPRPVDEWLAAPDATPAATRLVLDPGEGRAARALSPPPRTVALAVGPEGGFGDGDRTALAAAGFSTLSLGPRILRTETAGIAAIAALQALYGDL